MARNKIDLYRLSISASRRTFLACCLSGTAYILYRFLGFSLPKKPIYMEINQQAPANGCLTLPDYLLFDKDGEAWALSRRCTHLGCKLNFLEVEQILECPCHQSRFSKNGEVVRGPAKKALTRFPVEKRETAPFYIITAS